MPPERSTALAVLARLRAELEGDRAALERCVADAREVLARRDATPLDRRDVAFGAVALHGWYTGLETALERVARCIDRAVPTGETSHRDLLSQAMTEVPGLRPALLPRALMPELVALLEFRHFFRHAYGVELEVERLVGNLERLLALAPLVDGVLAQFDAFLGAAATALAEH